MPNDSSYSTVIDAPRIYPQFTSWRDEQGNPIFMVSIESDGSVSVNLIRMTCEEVERFIQDMTEQYEVFMEHYLSSQPSVTEEE